MKITIYKLLGLVKDGKAPKKIKTNTGIFKLEIEDDQLNYRCNDGGILTFDYYIKNNKLSDEIEIIEEDKKIEKLNTSIINANRYDYDKNKEMTISNITADILSISKAINELIDEVNKMKEGK